MFLGPRLALARLGAALALATAVIWPSTVAAAGWYLLLAPGAAELVTGGRASAGPPLTEWQNLGAFDAAQDCETVRRRWVTEFLAVIHRTSPLASAFEEAASDYKNATVLSTLIECVATDDPRLGGPGPSRPPRSGRPAPGTGHGHAWYLMVPPMEYVENSEERRVPWPAFRAPLRAWKQFRAFDSAHACEEEQQRRWLEAVRENDQHPARDADNTAARLAAERQLLFGKCIAVEDLRLK